MLIELSAQRPTDPSHTMENQPENQAAENAPQPAGPTGSEPEDPSQEGAEEPLPSSLLGFILVPALLVFVVVLIGWGVQKLTIGRRTFTDYAQQLGSDDKKVRWMAAVELLERKDAPAAELTSILIEIVDSSNESQEMVQEGWVLGDILKSPEEKKINLRWFATVALAKIGSQRAYDKLIELTEDDDTGVRLYAAHGLGRIRNPEALARLFELLAQDPDWGTRAAAAHAMGEIGDPKAIEHLARAIRDDTVQDVQINCAIALARLGNDGGQPLLEEITHDAQAEPSVRNQARKALYLLEHNK